MGRLVRWDYRAVFTGESKLQDRLSEWGAEGWELVTCQRVVPGYQLVFKRPRAPAEGGNR